MKRFSSGDFIVVRINEPELSSVSNSLLKELRPIGVHFGKEAFLADETYQVWLKEFQNLRREISLATTRERMIFAIDHEGGRVNRLPIPFTRFSYPLNWEAQSHKIGEAMGRELRSLGINVVFGPSLDIFSNPDNTVIGPRSFGKTSEIVQNYAGSFITGIESQGVLSTVKHFPGHGDTKEDSHFELPVLDYDLDFLKKRELLPFKYAVGAGVRSIMLAHILFRKLDNDFPSSLSKSCALDMVREYLYFDGVTFTDDLDMKAIKDNYSSDQIAESLMRYEINFGVFNHSYEHALEVGECLGKIAKKFPNALANTQRRTSDFVSSLQMHEVKALPESVFSAHQKLCESVPERYTVQIHEFLG